MSQVEPLQGGGSSPQPGGSGGALSALILHHAVTLILTIGVLALGIWGYLNYRKGAFTLGAEGGEPATQRYLIQSQTARIQLAADTYILLQNTAPLSLDALVDQGLLQPSDLYYPSREVTYSLKPRRGGEGVEVEFTLSPRAALSSQPEITPIDE